MTMMINFVLVGLLMTLVHVSDVTAFAPPVMMPFSVSARTRGTTTITSRTSFTSSLFGIRDLFQKNNPDSSNTEIEYVSICIIGGGVSGLTAAITAADQLSSSSSSSSSICVVEASPTFGGRVQSDVTEDGFILDRGFAVFIEKYPLAQQLLKYEELKLAPFLPGAMIKLPTTTTSTTTSTTTTTTTTDDQPVLFAKVADPLRQPQELFTALLAPVGTIWDKVKVLPLLYHVFTNSVQDLFDEEPETSTLEALKDRWGFSNTIIDMFYRPFLEGIYLAPLEQQSSRMFHFVMKMFSEGAAMLPQNGIGAVSQQLMNQAQSKPNVSLKSSWAVKSIQQQVPSSNDDNNDPSITSSATTTTTGTFLIESMDPARRIVADQVIVATDGSVAESLITPLVPELEQLDAPPIVQRSVGCLYYTFPGDAPISEPILILSGEPNRGISSEFPINNVCFPSVVVRQAADGSAVNDHSYAPPGQSLCSVTILKRTMARYKDRPEELDQLVKKQLATWFPNANVMETWTLKRLYSIPNAQPSQWTSATASTSTTSAVANINGGRDCTTFRGVSLPPNMYLCGDFMATATLNGALESGINAGKAAAAATASMMTTSYNSPSKTTTTTTSTITT